MTSEIGGFALTGDGGAVLALRQGLFCLDLDSGALNLLEPPPFDPSLFRFNEGACDANGRFWIGVMFDPLKGSRLDGEEGFTVSLLRKGSVKSRMPLSCTTAWPGAAPARLCSCRTAIRARSLR
jgi:sugar lactone lactonase YvrE